MALVAFVRGLNVGGHRIFRPTMLAEQLSHLDAVNIGATGILVIRRPVNRTRLRAELARRMPFEARVMICDGRDIIRLLSRDLFAGHQDRPDIIRFVSLLARRPRKLPRLPLTLPSDGEWLLKVLTCEGPFIVGLYRREMKAIGQLGALDRVFGTPLTTRSWGTMRSIAKVLTPGVDA